MRKFELGVRGEVPKTYIPPVQKQKQLRSEKIVRIYPPKKLGPPSETGCYIYSVTPQDLEIKLRSEHYDDGGLFLSYKEYHERFLKVPEKTMQPEQSIPDFSILTDEEYSELHQKLVGYLYDNNYATKAVLKKLTIEKMAEKYKIPNSVFVINSEVLN